MGWRKALGLCEHEWKIIKSRFVPPIARAFNLTGWDGEWVAQKLLLGYTVRTWECQKCSKRKSDTVLGDERKNVETYE